ncbi:MAG: alpha/beta hydrolase [Burkholderiaceae bacterium]|nr:alpha/beta hydrolase [Burkholderiaceae bacterium]
MPVLDINGARLYHEVHGRGDEVIVFAHGRGGNHLSWWQQLPAFTDRYRCLTFDHRSFGASTNPAPAAGQEAYAPDLLALLDHLRMDKVHLVAQSMGGRTCLDFALAHPQRVSRMVLADTVAGVVDPELKELLAAFGFSHADLMQRVLSAGFLKREPVLSFLYSQIEALNHIQGTPIKLVPQGPDRDSLQACQVPTLLIVGDEDALSPPQAIAWMARQMPRSRMAVIEGAGHSAYFEKPLEFNRLVAQFLAGS